MPGISRKEEVSQTVEVGWIEGLEMSAGTFRSADKALQPKKIIAGRTL
jgi:hypothetical protein